jgi:hypothetical protein
MSISDLINNNNNYKLFFLQSVLLGIIYGKSNKNNYYKDNIEKEIKKIINEINISRDSSNKNDNNIQANQINNESEKLNENSNNENSNNEKINNQIEKLENQKKYILSLIQKLSSNNYGYNYSRINILKNNIIYINKEIEKNKLLLKNQMNQNQMNQNQMNRNQMNRKQINRKQMNENIVSTPKNLVGELEKTLGNLSNLFIS